MSRPFARHWERKLRPLPRLGRGATIGGKPAWQVAEERAKAQQQERKAND